MRDFANPAAIETALVALLQAAADLDLKEAAEPVPDGLTITPRPFNPGPVLYGKEPIPTAEQAKVSALVGNPLGAAYRHGANRLGQALFDVGGRELMEQVAGRVQDGPQAGRRITVLDHAWHGVGRDGDRWWS